MYNFTTNLLNAIDQSGDLADIYKSVGEFADAFVAPVDAGLVATNKFPHALWRNIGEMNLHAITIAPEFGGPGFPNQYSVHMAAMERISEASGSIGLSYIAHSNLCINQISLNGTQEQKEKYLPKLASGEYVGGLAMSEAGAGSDVMAMRLKATKMDGGWQIDGLKQWITNGGTADILVVYAKTDAGITSFLVDTKNNDGFKPLKKEDKIGMRGSETWQLAFDQCFVPDENVLGEVNKGEAVLKRGLNYERLLLAGGPLGLAKSALDITKKYLAERVQFNAPLLQKQALAHEIARLESRYMMARAHAYEAAAKADQGLLDKDLAASVFFETSDMAVKLTQHCITLAGGMGYTNDMPLGQKHQDAQLYEIGGGARHIRLEIIAASLMKSHTRLDFEQSAGIKTEEIFDPQTGQDKNYTHIEDGPRGMAGLAFAHTLRHMKRADHPFPLKENQALAHKMAEIYSRILMVNAYARNVQKMPRNDALQSSLNYEIAEMLCDVTQECCKIGSLPHDSLVFRLAQLALVATTADGSNHRKLEDMAREWMPVYHPHQPVAPETLIHDAPGFDN